MNIQFSDFYLAILLYGEGNTIARTPEVGTTVCVRDLSGDGLSSKDKVAIPENGTSVVLVEQWSENRTYVGRLFIGMSTMQCTSIVSQNEKIISGYNINMTKRILFILSIFLLTIMSWYFGIYNSTRLLSCDNNPYPDNSRTPPLVSSSGVLLNPYPDNSRTPPLVPSSGVLLESFQIQEGATSTPPSTNAPLTYTRVGQYLKDSDYVKNSRDNLNITYHDDLQKNGGNSLYNTQMGTQKVYDVNGNLIDVISNAVQGNIVYYKPGSYKYGASTYVPYYEDSVFLSRSINAVVNTPTYLSTNNSGGFCNKYKTSPIQLEEKCNKINDETCAATTCCVLLGGQKCVYGNESGPIMKDNYSDFMIANKDFYYYKGKCYGDCPNTSQLDAPSLPDKVPYMNT